MGLSAYYVCVMSRTPRRIAIVVTLAAAAGCPGRDALVDQVGGAPRQQLDEVRVRVHAAEVKIQQKTDAAAAANATE
jgi:hypothetical protein